MSNSIEEQFKKGRLDFSEKYKELKIYLSSIKQHLGPIQPHAPDCLQSKTEKGVRLHALSRDVNPLPVFLELVSDNDGTELPFIRV